MCQTEIDISVNDKEESTMEINRVGVDLAKMFFSYMVLTTGANASGSAAISGKMVRGFMRHR